MRCIYKHRSRNEGRESIGWCLIIVGLSSMGNLMGKIVVCRQQLATEGTNRRYFRASYWRTRSRGRGKVSVLHCRGYCKGSAHVAGESRRGPTVRSRIDEDGQWCWWPTTSEQ